MFISLHTNIVQNVSWRNRTNCSHIQFIAILFWSLFKHDISSFASDHRLYQLQQTEPCNVREFRLSYEQIRVYTLNARFFFGRVRSEASVFGDGSLSWLCGCHCPMCVQTEILVSTRGGRSVGHALACRMNTRRLAHKRKLNALVKIAKRTPNRTESPPPSIWLSLCSWLCSSECLRFYSTFCERRLDSCALWVFVCVSPHVWCDRRCVHPIVGSLVGPFVCPSVCPISRTRTALFLGRLRHLPCVPMVYAHIRMAHITHKPARVGETCTRIILALFARNSALSW